MWQALKAWWNEDCARDAAAIAFYTILSLSPFLVLALAVTQLFVAGTSALAHLQGQLEGLIGPDASRVVVDMIARAGDSDHSGVAAMAGAGMTMFAATASIVQLRAALDRLLGKPDATGTLRAAVRIRVVAVLLGLALGFMIVVSLILSAVVAFVVASAGVATPRWLLLGANEIVATGLVAVLFLALLRFVPTRKLPLRASILGAMTAAALFEAAKFAIGWYVAGSAAVHAYGAAGSVVVLMLWVYYVAGIFLLGALVAREMARTSAGATSRSTSLSTQRHGA